MHKSQQARIASALAGVPAPPKGAALVRQSDQRHDRIRSADLAPHGRPPRRDLVTTDQLARAAKARKASSSVTGSGGGDNASASGPKGNLRDEISAAMERR